MYTIFGGYVLGAYLTVNGILHDPPAVGRAIHQDAKEFPKEIISERNCQKFGGEGGPRTLDPLRGAIAYKASPLPLWHLSVMVGATRLERASSAYEGSALSC